MLQNPSFVFGTNPEEYAPEPVPTMAEWRELWISWETVTLGMIPKDQLLSKPIDLRNPCIFYLGHIPTFLDVLLIRATKCDPTEPKYFLDIFQRGIDPDVDDPTQCHKHSDIPESWPELDEILHYQNRVRQRVEGLYRKGSAMHQTPDVQRALWMAFEHEAMHLETLLYMLLQSDTTLPPPGTIIPDFASGRTWEKRKDAPKGNSWVNIPEITLDVGMVDPEDPENPNPHFFGWDNEKPVQKNVKVPPFCVRAYPITNGEYAKYLEGQSSDNIPVSWTIKDVQTAINGGNKSSFKDKIYVKTVFGPVPLKLAMDWPVMASYDELAGCAKWMNSRIPTAEEVSAVYRYAEETDLAVEKKLTKKIDAVNGRVINSYKPQPLT